MDRIEVDVTLWAPEDYPNSAAFTCDFDVQAVFGSRGRIPVRLTVDGHVFRSSLAPMDGRHMMVFNQEMRKATGYKAGDKVHLLLERDTETREINFPQDVLEVIKTNPAAYDKLTKYSYSHKKEVLGWIDDAKKPETRLRRIQKLIQTLSE